MVPAVVMIITGIFIKVTGDGNDRFSVGGVEHLEERAGRSPPPRPLVDY